jgi:hypothetical protein
LIWRSAGSDHHGERIVANGKRATAAHHNTVNTFETGRYAGKSETIAAMRKALEEAGVRFLAKGVELAT